ncbi:SpoIIE family protein phosphatase [Streptomyces sp. NPDC058964]|uniref:SpoIIE family protein phosphatase n=1 Tax=Streptomyces sp. NPDC058964 TaxID=3346681 RepID=UPI003686B51C
MALFDPDGRVLTWNSAAQALTGHAVREIVGRDAAALADRATVRGSELVRRLVRAAGGVRTDWVRCPDGTCRAIAWHPVPVPLATGTGLLAVAVPEVQQIHQCDAAMADHLLHSSPIGLAVLDKDLRFRFVNEALARVNGLPVGEHLGRSILDVLDLPDPQAYERVLRRVVDDGETVDNLQVAAIGPDGRPYAAMGTLFPLRDSEGRVVGQAGVVRELGATRHELLDAAQERRRMELLGRVGATLGHGLDLGGVAAKLATVCVPEFARAVTVELLRAVVHPDSDTAFTDLDGTASADAPADAGDLPWVHRLTASAGRDDSRPDDALEGPRPAADPVADCVRTAGPVAYRTGEHGAGPEHGIAVPLSAGGRVLGCVTFLRYDREFGNEDIRTAHDIATRTAIAIDNALLYRRERLATLTLQRHLLPSGLPTTPWARTAHRYSPAQDGTLAGGDWYDSVLLPGGRIGLSIGDVMGHGLSAAAAMGRYRSCTRALLSVGLLPGQLLTRLDDLADGVPGHKLAATCACVVYDGVSGLLQVALAGHPPPLLIRPDGTAGTLGGEPGPPVGMGLDPVYRETRHVVDPGSLLVLYTDGMIEDRSRALDLDQGIAVLSRAVRDPRAPLGEVCDALMAARPVSSVDDAALLVTRLARLQGGIAHKPS